MPPSAEFVAQKGGPKRLLVEKGGVTALEEISLLYGLEAGGIGEGPGAFGADHFL